MFYFFLNILAYFILFLIIYYCISQKHITILDFLMMFFLLNIYFVFILNEINFIVGLLMTLMVVLIKCLYQYLYTLNEIKSSKNNVLINRGHLNFKGLIDNKYSYQKLITNLKRKGIKKIEDIDYCALYNNELIVFRSDIKHYPVSLIIDGKVLNDNLLSIKKDREWLQTSLDNHNLVLDEVSYAFYKNDKLYFLTNM